MDLRNLASDLPPRVPNEIFEPLLAGRGFRLERIVSTGQITPPGTWFDQDEEEWVLLLAGAARLKFEGDAYDVALKPGDALLIPAHRRHRVEWTDTATATVWIAVYFSR
ncbi:MAG: cupin domain-containing protein [Planctomycetes bacterium]|nr:cupin domain-containing protein [Planctomycetota bacterium]